PAPIAVTAAPRSPAAARSAASAPAARATSSRLTSGSRPAGSRTPASTTTTPRSSSRSRRKAYSPLFVSSVPSRTTVLTSRPLREGLDAEVAPLELHVARELRGGGLGRDRARDHHQLALGDRRRHAEVLLDQENREPFLL